MTAAALLVLAVLAAAIIAVVALHVFADRQRRILRDDLYGDENNPFGMWSRNP